MRKRSTEILEKLILSNSKSMEVNKLITTYRGSWNRHSPSCICGQQ